MSRHYFEIVHSLDSHFRFWVMLKLYDRMALILPGVGILWKLNCVNTAERREPISYVLLRQSSESTSKTAYINSVILFSMQMLVAGCQRVSNLGYFVLVIPKNIKRQINTQYDYLLFIFSSSCCSILLCLRSLNHNCLSTQLLVRHCKCHQHWFGRVKFYICDSNKWTKMVKYISCVLW